MKIASFDPTPECRSRHPFPSMALLLASALLLPFFSSIAAQEIRGLTIGARVGFTGPNMDHDFEQVELSASRDLPWGWDLPAHFRLITRFETSGGALMSQGDAAFIGYFGPSLLFERSGHRYSLEWGVRPTFLSDDRIGETDLGGVFYFATSLGVQVNMRGPVRLGYRIHHMSNAGIDHPNPGVNLHVLELVTFYP